MVGTGIAALVSIALVARIWLRSWLTPGAVFASVWSVVAILSATQAGSQMSSGAILWIVLGAAAVFAGDVVGAFLVPRGEKTYNARNEQTWTTVTLPYWSWLVGACIIAGFLFAVLYGRLRQPPLGAQSLLVAVYLGPALGGLGLALSAAKMHRLLSILSLAPVFLVGAIRTGRSGIVLAMIIFGGAYLAGMIFKHQGRVRVLTPRRLSALLIALMVIVAENFLFTHLRMQLYAIPNPGLRDYLQAMNMDREKITIAWTLSKYNIMGILPGLSQWLEEHSVTPSRLGLGYFTFQGPLRLIGLLEERQVYESVTIGYVQEFQGYIIDPLVLSNVYSLFRDLIQDFSEPGALLALFLLGMMGSVAYSSVAKRQIALLPLLMLFYITIGYSPLSSVFWYNSVNASLLLCVIYTILMRQSVKKSRIPSG